MSHSHACPICSVKYMCPDPFGCVEDEMEYANLVCIPCVAKGKKVPALIRALRDLCFRRN